MSGRPRALLVVRAFACLASSHEPQKPITELGSKQLLTYLKLKGLRLGFVLNFGGNLMKDGIERIVNGLCDANLGSAMSKKYAISRKSFVQPQSILLLSIAFLSGSGP